MEVGSVSSYMDVSQRTNREQELGKNEFFKILSAQLQFQDPMEGGDNSQYVAQLAQFSTLEQMENLNQAMADLQSNQNLLFGSQMIGKIVEVLGDSGSVKGEVQSVRIRQSDLYVVVEDTEYPAKDIVDLSEGIDLEMGALLEEMSHIGQILNEAFVVEPEQTMETL